jgi:hypothetical protein
MDRAHDGCAGLAGVMRVPERPEISSATLAFAGWGNDGRRVCVRQGKKGVIKADRE